MNPKFWGPGAWTFLHSVTMSYPKNPTEEDKRVYATFFKSLQDVLPCEKCSYNYSNNLHKHPIERSLGSRKDMIQWLITIHNEVNKETHKRTYTYDEVIEEYKYKMKHMDSDETIVYKVIILALLVFIGYKFFTK